MPDNECAIVALPPPPPTLPVPAPPSVLLLNALLPLRPLMPRARLNILGGPPGIFNEVRHPLNNGLFGLVGDVLRPDNRRLYREFSVDGFIFDELRHDDDDRFDTGSHSISSEYEFDELLPAKLLFKVDDGFKLLTASKLFT